MTAAARENPDIQFCHATGTQAHSENLPDLHNCFASIYEGRYLAGIAAGMKAKEIGNPKLGYVGAYPYAEVISGYTAFYLGRQEASSRRDHGRHLHEYLEQCQPGEPDRPGPHRPGLRRHQPALRLHRPRHHRRDERCVPGGL